MMTYFAFLFLAEIVTSAAILLVGLGLLAPYGYEKKGKDYIAEPIQLRKAA